MMNVYSCTGKEASVRGRQKRREKLLMKKERNYSSYMRESGKRGRRRNPKLAGGIMLAGCLAALVLVVYLAGLLYMWLEKEFGRGKETSSGAVVGENVTYTQEELDIKIAEASQTAAKSASARILDELKAGLSSGVTMVETLRPLYPDELVIVSNGVFNFVPIRDDLKKNAYLEENMNILESGEIQYLENGQVISHKGIDVSKFQGEIDWNLVAQDGVEYAFIRNILESGEIQYLENGQVISHKGIDVSKFQGEIDWNLVAQDGVEYAFIRVGNRGYGTGKLVEDEAFEANVEGALSAGLKVGVYMYTQAVNDAELLEEANFVLQKIAPYKIECPVVFDVEKVVGDNGRMNAISVEERTRLTKLFCDTIAAAGYKPMIYHNMEMGAMMLELSELQQYDKWFAYYNPDLYWPYEYQIWQYTDKGRVNGIEGEVDLNISFAPLWE